MDTTSRLRTLERRCLLLSGAVAVMAVLFGLTIFLAADNTSGPVDLPAVRSSLFTKDAPAECLYAREIIVVDENGVEGIRLSVRGNGEGGAILNMHYDPSSLWVTSSTNALPVIGFSAHAHKTAGEFSLFYSPGNTTRRAYTWEVP